MAEPPLSSNNPFRRKPAASASASQPSQTTTTTSTTANFDSSGASGLFAHASFSPASSSAQKHPTGDEFRQQLQSFLPSSSSAAEAPPPSTSFAISTTRTKPVKKVRVQSPPPSPPSSPSLPSSPSSVDGDFEARFPASGVITQPTPLRPGLATLEHGDYSDSDDDTAAAQTTETTRPIQTIQHPHNPFQRTLSDLEPAKNDGAGEALGGGATIAGGPKALDVDAFSRLLLTGQGPVPAAAPAAPAAQAPVGAASPDAKAAARPTPRVKPPPPPPSSRHGKLIKPTEVGLSSTQTEPRSRSGSGSGSGSGNGHADAGKPLPPRPTRRRSLSGGAASISEDDNKDREYKQDKHEDKDTNASSSDSDDAPEPRPLTPPNASHAAAASEVSDLGLLPPASTVTVAASTAKTAATPKKPTPAPPPRRQPHARSDSHHLPQPQLSVQRDRSPGASPRSSLDSARGSFSLHPPSGAAAPAPPPPRRGGHASRPSVSLGVDFDKLSPGATSSSSNSSSHSLQAAAPTAVHIAVPTIVNTAVPAAAPTAALAPLKHSKPPPPPARHASVRKDRADRPDREKRLSKLPSSNLALGLAPTSSSAAHHPPPPPPRQRGSSRGSMDGPGALPATPRQVSGEGVRRVVGTAEEEKTEDGPSAATDILADLDALQREVDALRGQFGNF
ncbi:hypothetical protein F503_03772 [Ophiostoma piceae UAMH 11346]|uniref:Uncharacterized protein n=1 Tax=Ophiostoma piceae (strain UAMH 11346) TaxID=1262450 RepID=S3BXA4_OPHP1|nr:hypothetical protein F503_03772 [Ophiostoma piceae UAMH 11346]